MAALVSLDFVKRALRVAEYGDGGEVLPIEDDALIQGYVDAVTEAVLRYLRARDNDWTEATLPKAVRLAIVLGVNSLYDTEQAELLSGLGSSDPKNPMVALLCMMRKPTLA